MLVLRVVPPGPGRLADLDMAMCARIVLLKNTWALYNDLHTAETIVLDMAHLSARLVLKVTLSIPTMRDIVHILLVRAINSHMVCGGPVEEHKFIRRCRNDIVFHVKID